MVENKKINIEAYGYDFDAIMKQNENYKSDKEKAKYLENVTNNIYEAIRVLRVVDRYASINIRKMRKMGREDDQKANKTEFIKQINLFKSNEISKRDVEKIFHLIVPDIKKLQSNIFWDFREAISKKYFDTDYEILVLDYFHTENEELTYNVRLFRYRANIVDKWRELYNVYLMIKKELKKYKMIDSFNILNEEESKVFNKNINELRAYERGELQLSLEPYIKELNLEFGEPVPSKKIRLITKKLINEGWDAKETSVAEAFRKMGFVKGRRK